MAHVSGNNVKLWNRFINPGRSSLHGNIQNYARPFSVVSSFSPIISFLTLIAWLYDIKIIWPTQPFYISLTIMFICILKLFAYFYNPSKCLSFSGLCLSRVNSWEGVELEIGQILADWQNYARLRVTWGRGSASPRYLPIRLTVLHVHGTICLISCKTLFKEKCAQVSVNWFYVCLSNQVRHSE